jgi:transcriptional regulator with XRE-family HTH domain
LSEAPSTPTPLTQARALRVARGLPMDRVAVGAGISVMSLRRIERSTLTVELDHMRLGHFRRLAAVLGVTIVELYPALAPKGDEPTNQPIPTDEVHP